MKLHWHSAIRYWYILALFAITSVYAFDNPHFFRPRLFPGEPRLVRKGLFTLDLTVDGGHATRSRNGCHNEVPLLDIYGVSNMQAAILNVPPNNLIESPECLGFDTLLNQLAVLPTNNCFAHLSFDGCLRVREAAFDAYYNFPCGWFAHLYLPIRSLTVEHIQRFDLSPTDVTPQPNRTNPIWQNVLNSFNEILGCFNLSTASYRSMGMGDMVMLFGWTHNEERSTTYLDFFDTTFEVGLLVPTGKRVNPHFAFSLATGYNGHFGFPLVFRSALGIFDWFTFGGSIEARFFVDSTACVRMKTACEQQGPILLAEGLAKRHLGSLWSFDIFTKADHVFKGFSLLLGYTYDIQRRSKLWPESPLFNLAIVNSDASLDSWNMHTLHLIADYDFAYDDRPWGPRIGLVYNQQLTGKNIFAPQRFGGVYFGIDFVYCW
jgi:hypothetical protein